MHAMFLGNLDDLINGKICTNGSILAPLSDHVSLIGLLTVHGESVFVGENGNCLE